MAYKNISQSIRFKLEILCCIILQEKWSCWISVKLTIGYHKKEQGLVR